jgi:hypothetical protein
MSSKLRLKKKKKLKPEIIVKTEIPIVTRSISMDSMTSYDIDIKDEKYTAK